MFEGSSVEQAIAFCESNKQFSIARFRSYSDHCTKNHKHFCFELFYSKTENCTILLNEKCLHIKPGDFLFILPGQNHSSVPRSTLESESISIFIHPEYLSLLMSGSHFLDDSLPDTDTIRFSLNLKEQKQFLYFIRTLENISGFGAELQAQSVFLQLLLFLSRKFSSFFSGNEQNFPHKNNLVDNIISYIDQNLQNPFSLQELADKFYISPNYLCRLFKSSTGMTPKQYMDRQKMELAKRLLEQGVSAGTVCSACGYNDYSSFFRIFIKFTGLSPKDYTNFSTLYKACQ